MQISSLLYSIKTFWLPSPTMNVQLSGVQLSGDYLYYLVLPFHHQLGVLCIVVFFIYWFKNFFSTGMSQASGVPGRRHIRATHNAPVVDNLINAGAIPFIQTNTSEACMWYESSNYVYGCTNNAYDINRIVGGSSGNGIW